MAAVHADDVRASFLFMGDLCESVAVELTCESVGKVELLSSHCDCKQSRDHVDLPSASQSHFLCL